MSIVKHVRSISEPIVSATINFHRDGCFDRATVIAYFGLLSFLPLAVFLVSIAALALGNEAAEKGTEAFLQNLLYTLPPELMNQVRSLRPDRFSGLGYVVLVIWTASKVFSKIESGLDQAEALRSRGENAAASGLLVRALRMALATRVPGALALSTEEIFERAEDDPTREIAARLRRIDRERFQPEAAPPETPALRSALEELRRSRR